MRSEIGSIYDEPVEGAMFQSSFYKDALWNYSSPWVRPGWDQFQSSFYKDALWNYPERLEIYEFQVVPVSILILQGCALKSDWGLELDACLGDVSILILQGCALKLYDHIDPEEARQFQSSFYKDALWNNEHAARATHSAEVSILILQGCALKYTGDVSG